MSLQIRKTKYRNQEGYLICGRFEFSGVFGTQIFTKTRVSAEVIKAKLLRNEKITHADFVLQKAI